MGFAGIPCATCDALWTLGCPQCEADSADRSRYHPMSGLDRCEEWVPVAPSAPWSPPPLTLGVDDGQDDPEWLRALDDVRAGR